MRILQVISPRIQESEPETAAAPSVVDFQQAFDAALSPLRAELQAVQEQLEAFPKEVPAPATPAEAQPDPRVDVLRQDFLRFQQQLDILEKSWHAKFQEIQASLEEIKAGTKDTTGTFNTAGTENTAGAEETAGTAKAGNFHTTGTFETAGPAVSKVPATPVPVVTAVPDVPSIPDVPSVPDVSLVPDVPLVPEVDVKPSLLRRCWDYLNAPAFKK